MLLPITVIACTGEDEQATSDLAGTATVSTTATSTPSPSPSPSIIAGLENATLVFLRGDTDPDYPMAGEIWLSAADGSNARQITPANVASSYVGLVRSNSGADLLYYLTQDAEGNTSIHSGDLNTGETVPLLSYADVPKYYFADISPDGRYVVHTQPLGLDMYDLTTGGSTTLLQSGSAADCAAYVFEECYRAIDPHWSQDGRLLKVVHTVYEGSWAEVVDPFQSPVVVFTPGGRSSPHNGFWSPASDALCAQGIGLAGSSGLYLLEYPDWEARNLIPEFEDSATNPGARTVVDCDWAGPATIAYLVTAEIPSREGELYTLDRVTGETRLIVKLATDSCCTGNVEALPDAPVAIAQILGSAGNLSVWSQPRLVVLETGVVTPILQEGDFILDSFSR